MPTPKLICGFTTLVACVLLANGATADESQSNPAADKAASGLSDAEIDQLRQTAAARCRAAFESESGKPFAPREIRVDWNNRGDFTRHYIQDTITFATRALHLNEQIEEANLALREMCQYHLDRPQTLLEIHSFPNAPRFLARLSLLYGPDGSRTKGLITEETHAVILKTLWTWCQSKLKFADTAIEPWHTWTGHSSENHHANHFASCWAATLLLSREPAFRDLIADQHTVKEHYAAWTAWVTEYLRQRGRKGMTVEIDSASYSQATLAAIYLIHDLAEQPELRQLASHYITLAWALWAEQQIQGVNGGAKTRHYPTSAKAAGNPLSAAAWYVLGSDDLPKPNRPPTSAFLTSNWQIPDVVLDIAFDVSGRGTYEAIQRKPGLRPAEEIEPPYKIHLAPDAPALVRYTYATPDFIMGSLFCDALPGEAWNNISSQNRWHGAIFAGDRNARIYPYGETVKSHYNAHWAAQKRGTLIAQKLKVSKNVTQHRVWFSREGLSEPIQEGAWYFAEADSAYAAVRVVSGEAAFEEESTDQRAHILTCADDLSPVILEVARKADFPDFKTFRKTVQALPFALDGTVLTYTGLSSDRFTFFADQSERPQINGERIDLGPEKVYDSPFVQSAWDSGIVTIQFRDKQHILDFNVAQEEDFKVGLIGDSTVAEQSGWGPAFAERFDSRATILNYAKNGATLEALSKKLDELVELKPDYVLIQFGHNDQKQYDTSVYSDHLKSYVERIRKAGGQPVIVSSVTRRSFDAKGKIVSNLVKNEKYNYQGTLTDYANAAEAVAKELNLPFIDLHRISIAHHNKIGREASMTYNFKEGDRTHFNRKGAEAITGLILEELKTVVPELATYVKVAAPSE